MRFRFENTRDNMILVYEGGNITDFIGYITIFNEMPGHIADIMLVMRYKVDFKKLLYQYSRYFKSTTLTVICSENMLNYYNQMGFTYTLPLSMISRRRTSRTSTDF